ncbi:CLUMA_CG019674, isoform A [Clunio marinus]|uniref:CLUMA_CG019674, isoform A n=1 Tax=Clunio marinus TaxID=568069 RepID=A0A1J1J2J6_9DIPT|nr:CLUMA_CG019674, isoform A [Clunio marinus]
MSRHFPLIGLFLPCHAIAADFLLLHDVSLVGKDVNSIICDTIKYQNQSRKDEDSFHCQQAFNRIKNEKYEKDFYARLFLFHYSSQLTFILQRKQFDNAEREITLNSERTQQHKKLIKRLKLDEAIWDCAIYSLRVENKRNTK